MKKNIPNEIIEEIILSKFKLFTKEVYFRYFRHILLELSNNIFAFRKKESLSLSITTTLKEKNFNSFWYIILKLIFPVKNQIKKEDIYETELNLNPLCFRYLKSLCYTKMKQFINLSNEEMIPLEQITSVYLNICEKRIKLNKQKEKLKFKMNLRASYRKSIFFGQQHFKSNKIESKINYKKIILKSGSNKKSLDYTNSYTRLFIGKTDDESIRERYLSNMVVKKHKQLHLLNSIGELSVMYLKRMYKKLFKSEEKTEVDNDMMKIIKQFENDHKKIDNFQRSSINNDKPHYMYDYNQNLLALELDKQKKEYNNNNDNNNIINNNNIKKIRNKRKQNKFKTTLFVSGEISKYNNNQETGFTLSNSKIIRKNNRYNSINYEKKKLGDSLMFTRRVINPYIINNKIKGAKRFSSNQTDRRLKKNISLFIDNNKKINFKNYLNKNDFFFF